MDNDVERDAPKKADRVRHEEADPTAPVLSRIDAKFQLGTPVTSLRREADNPTAAFERQSRH